MSLVLRDYQEEVLGRLRDAFKRYRSVILQMPTGSGKTGVAAAVAEGLAKNGRSMLALVHRRELVDQFCETLEQVGLHGRYGVIASGRAPTPWAKFQVASIQTLYRRESLGSTPRYLVVDECHHARAKTWESVLSRFPNSKVLGLTATPSRLDGKPLGEHFEEIVEGPSIQWLTAHGWLAPITMKYAPRGISTKGIKTVAGDYNKKEVGERIDRKAIVAPVRAFLKYARDRRTIYFAVNTQDSEDVCSLLRQHGVRASHVDGETPVGLRRTIIGDFKRGDAQVLCNVDIVGEGTDVPQCDCVMLGSPTKSVTRYLQWCGRPVRPDHGRDALILDLVENFWRHGRPDTPRKWFLHLDQSATNEASEVTVANTAQRVCEECATVYPSTRKQCPNCGESKTLPKPRHLEIDLTEGDIGGMDPKSKNSLAQVRNDLMAVVRQGGGRGAIREIREKHGLTARWESNAISALNL